VASVMAPLYFGDMFSVGHAARAKALDGSVTELSHACSQCRYLSS
jgi:hypothetical protein